MLKCDPYFQRGLDAPDSAAIGVVKSGPKTASSPSSSSFKTDPSKSSSLEESSPLPLSITNDKGRSSLMAAIREAGSKREHPKHKVVAMRTTPQISSSSATDPGKSSSLEEEAIAPDPPLSTVTDGRSSLMAAIRQVGGPGGLRSTSKRKSEYDVKRKKEAKALPVEGNLLDELASRLTLRRKGIAGSSRPEPSSALERMSSMIAGPEIDDVEDEDSKDEDSNEEWED